MCRNARGTRRRPGLQSIDGRTVSLDDRIRALAMMAGANEAAQNAERWRLVLIGCFGHARVAQGAEFFAEARAADFGGAGLCGAVDVAAFRSLQRLDLSNNRLKEVRGLELLICLRVCDVSGNPELDTQRVLQQLSPHVGLEHVAVRANPQRQPVDLAFIKRVVQSLPLADRLSAVDGVAITPADRVAIVSQTVKMSRAELVAFNVNLALLCASSPVLGRDYNVRSVLARRHVVAAQMQQLYGLAGLRLRYVGFRGMAGQGNPWAAK